MNTLKALILTIIVLNLVRKGPSFYYAALFRGPHMTLAVYSSFRK